MGQTKKKRAHMKDGMACDKGLAMSLHVFGKMHENRTTYDLLV